MDTPKTETESPPSPQFVVIRRPRRHRHSEREGAWKIAMADFALAMMALFMVLWIVNSSNAEQRKAIAEYFKPTLAKIDPSLDSQPGSAFVIDLGGTPGVTPNINDQHDSYLHQEAPTLAESNAQTENKEAEGPETDHSQLTDHHGQAWLQVKQQLAAQILANPLLRQFDQQLSIDISDQGLRLQLVDRMQTPMFTAGSTQLSYLAEDILWELGPILATSGYRLALIGHTDSRVFMLDHQNKQQQSNSHHDDSSDGNWWLSAARADAARRAIMEAGVSKAQISYVMGVGDSQPLDKQQPEHAVNRRISIIFTQPLMPEDTLNIDVSQTSVSTDRDQSTKYNTRPEAISVSGLAEHWRTLFDERKQWPASADSPSVY